MTRVRVRRSPGLPPRLAESTQSDTGSPLRFPADERISSVFLALPKPVIRVRLSAASTLGTCASLSTISVPVEQIPLPVSQYSRRGESPRGTPGCGQKAASKFSDAQKAFILKHCNDGVPVAKILMRNGRHAMIVSVSMLKLCDV
jgi:hypothetical protein